MDLWPCSRRQRKLSSVFLPVCGRRFWQTRRNWLVSLRSTLFHPSIHFLLFFMSKKCFNPVPRSILYPFYVLDVLDFHVVEKTYFARGLRNDDVLDTLNKANTLTVTIRHDRRTGEFLFVLIEIWSFFVCFIFVMLLSRCCHARFRSWFLLCFICQKRDWDGAASTTREANSRWRWTTPRLSTLTGPPRPVSFRWSTKSCCHRNSSQNTTWKIWKIFSKFSDHYSNSVTRTLCSFLIKILWFFPSPSHHHPFSLFQFCAVNNLPRNSLESAWFNRVNDEQYMLTVQCTCHLQITHRICRNKRPGRLIFRSKKRNFNTHQKPSVFCVLWKITVFGERLFWVGRLFRQIRYIKNQEMPLRPELPSFKTLRPGFKSMPCQVKQICSFCDNEFLIFVKTYARNPCLLLNQSVEWKNRHLEDLGWPSWASVMCLRV